MYLATVSLLVFSCCLSFVFSFPMRDWLPGSSRGVQQYEIQNSSGNDSLHEALFEDAERSAEVESDSTQKDTSATIEWFDNHVKNVKDTIYKAASAYLELLQYEEAYAAQQMHYEMNDRRSLHQLRIYSKGYQDAHRRFVSSPTILKPLHSNAEYFLTEMKGSKKSTDGYKRMKMHEQDLKNLLHWAKAPLRYKSERDESTSYWQHFYEQTVHQRQRIEGILQAYVP